MWLDYFSDLTKFWTWLISWSLPTQVYLQINYVENGKVISAAIKLFVDYVWWRWLTVQQVQNSELKSGLLDKEWKRIHTKKHASDENLLGTMNSKHMSPQVQNRSIIGPTIWTILHLFG